MTQHGSAPDAAALPRHDYDRIAYGISFREAAAFKDTYGGGESSVFLEAHRLVPRGRAAGTVIVMMHPIGGGAYLPMVTALARAGCHVIFCNSRYRGNDTALIMEKCVLDLGACVRHARETLGYQRVVLGGWSGGGSLSLFYQAEAERPTLTATPAGDPPDLTRAELLPADGVMLLAAHMSRAAILTESMDPSIVDESDPERRDPELDLYDPRNPNRPPYPADYVRRFRDAQVARNRRITARARETLEHLRTRGQEHGERAFVVHGTMADPRWLDATLEPSDRAIGHCFLGDPATVNDGPVGLGRFSTLRSWLSQWSFDESRANGPVCAARIAAPIFVLRNGADDAVPPSHPQRLFDAIAHSRKEMVEIPGAGHYYFGQQAQLDQAVGHCLSWLERNQLG
jgi:pimeloyl-ACP methyl ester carboxylesterase